MKAILPKNSGHCDLCGSILIIRDDDKENIIKERMLIYKEKSEPILNYYRDFCSVIDFEAKNGVDDFPNMRDLL